MRALMIIGAVSVIIFVSAASFIFEVSEETIFLGILLFLCVVVVFSLFMFFFLSIREKIIARKKSTRNAEPDGVSENQDADRQDDRNTMNLPSSVLRTSMAPSVLDPDFNHDPFSGGSENDSENSDYSQDFSDSNKNEGW